MREVLLITVFVSVVVGIIFNFNELLRPRSSAADQGSGPVGFKPVQALDYDADRNALFVKSWNVSLEEITLGNRDSQTIETPLSFFSFDASERNSTVVMLSQWMENNHLTQGVHILRGNELIVSEEFLVERCMMGDVRISADGDLAMFVGHDGQIVGWNLKDVADIERWECQLETTANTNSLSPDGQRLFIISREGVSSIRDSRTGKLLVALPKISGSARQVTWSGDSKRVATAGLDGSIYILDGYSGNEIWKMRDSLFFARVLKFSPNGEYLAFGGFDNLIRIWNFARKKDEPVVLAGSSGQVGDIVFTESGSKLIAGSQDGTIREWSMNSREMLRQIR